MPEDTVKRSFRIVGESFYKDAICSLGEQNPKYARFRASVLPDELVGDADAPEPVYCYQYTFPRDMEVSLVPEPENEHDPNAVAVMFNGVKVGYVARGRVSEARNLLNSGDIVRISGRIKGGPVKIKNAEPPEDGEEDPVNNEFSVSVVVEKKAPNKQAAKPKEERQAPCQPTVAADRKPTETYEKSKSYLWAVLAIAAVVCVLIWLIYGR